MKLFTDILIRFPRLILVTMFFLTVLIGLGMSKLEIRDSYDSDLPANDAIVKTNDLLEEIFGEKDILMIAVISENIFAPSTLQKIQLISEEILQIDGVIQDQVTSLSTLTTIEGNDWGLEVGDLMEDIPASNEEISELIAKVKSNPLFYGKLVSEDFNASLILANMERSVDNQVVYNEVYRILEKYSGPEKFYPNGPAVMSAEVDNGIEADVSTLMPIAILFIMIGFFLSFGKMRGVFLPFTVAVTSIVWAMGFAGHAGFGLTVVSNAVPMVMIAIASSYGIHLMHRYFDDVKTMDRISAVKSTIMNMGPPIILTGLTSAAGSATLAVFKVTSLREFGIITSIGILSALVITLVIPPAILVLLRKPKEISNGFGEGLEKIWDTFLSVINTISTRKVKWVKLVTLLIVIISFVGITKVKFGSDYVSMFPGDHRIHEIFDAYNDNLGGSRYFNIMISGIEQDDITEPDLLKSIANFQEYAESLPDVGYTDSFADIIRRINVVMNNGDIAYDRIPDSQELISQYLLLYSMSGDPGDFEDIVDYAYQRSKIRVMIQTSDQERHLELLASLTSWGKENFPANVTIEYGGSVMIWLALIQYIVVGQVQNVILALLIVFLFCAFVFKSLSAGLLSIVPLTISSLITFGLMGYMGIRLEMGTAIVTAIAVGVGVDFSIHFISRYKDEYQISNDLTTAGSVTMSTAGKAIIFDMISNILGFSVLLFSGFTPIQNFGWLVSLTMITSGFGSLILLPPLITTLKPKFIMQSPNGKNDTSDIFIQNLLKNDGVVDAA